MSKKNTPKKGRNRLASLRLIILVVLLTCVILFVSSFGGRFGIIHELTLEVLGPAQTLITKASGRVNTLWERYIALWAVRDENERLSLMIDEYHAKLNEHMEAYATYLSLQEKLEFRAKDSFPSITARAVGKDPSFWFQTIIVDRGKKDGVVLGMVARTERGVVGQVIQVSPHYSKILLANAPSSAIDAMVQKNRVRGILKGVGKRGYILQYVLKNADVSVGDKIVTAGIGGVYSSGIPLGVVSVVQKKRRGMFQEIEVTPAVNFQRLEVVFINLTERMNYQEEMSTDSNEVGK